MKTRRKAVIGAGLALAVGAAGQAHAGKPLKLPQNEPEPVTAYTERVSGFDVSRDGSAMVFALTDGPSSDLYLRQLSARDFSLPKRLTNDPAVEREPALSPDNRLLVYVSTKDDVKGDIFLLDLATLKETKLTGSQTEDGAPVFSADGKRVYFHLANPGDQSFSLASLELGKPLAPKILQTGGDARNPCPSPDGKTLAFVTRNADSTQSVKLLDLAMGDAKTLTEGANADSSPAFSPDGKKVYFVRSFLDTDGDGNITTRDRGVLFRVAALGGTPEPLTSPAQNFRSPKPHGNLVYFVSDPNVLKLPLAGEIPDAANPGDQLAWAKIFADQTPPLNDLAWLGYAKAAVNFPADAKVSAAAQLGAARLLAELGHPEQSISAYQSPTLTIAGAEPESALAHLEQTRLVALERAKSALGSVERAKALEEGAAAIDGALSSHPSQGLVQARAGILKAGLLLEPGMGADAINRAVTILREVAAKHPGERESCAQAGYLLAQAYANLNMQKEVRERYLALVRDYPDVPLWPDLAAQRILDDIEAAAKELTLDERVKLLRDFVNQTDMPRLKAGAINRVGDLYFRADEWQKAKSAYREVLGGYPDATTQRASARLALAEILYREERFGEALSLYENQLTDKGYEDRLYILARQGYIKKSLASAENLVLGGEILPARAIFKELLDYDDQIVEAHRGYIKCAAALGNLEAALKNYTAKAQAAKANPSEGDAVYLYGVGLALSYRETREDLLSAIDWIKQAIYLKGRVPYFHQTLGYCQELLATAHAMPEMLDHAAQSYKKALVLTDPAKSPDNHAYILLNMANAGHLMKNDEEALRYYRQAQSAGIKFQSQEQKLLFLLNYGISAFRSNENALAASLFTKALEVAEPLSDPSSAVGAFDGLMRYSFDEVVRRAPPGLEQKANEAGEALSDLSRSMALLASSPVKSPPDPSWPSFRQGVEKLAGDFEALRAQKLAPLVPQKDAERIGAGLDQKLKLLKDALRRPDRYGKLRAELNSRLGLALHEGEDYAGAREAFERAYKINEGLGQTSELLLNRRSVAHALYREAQGKREGQKSELLNQSRDHFMAAAELLKKYGVKERGESEGSGLVTLSQTVKGEESTKAAYGFSREQEQNLIDAFLGRIALELGELKTASEFVGAQTAGFTTGGEIAREDYFSAAVLLNRKGGLDAAANDWEGAFRAFDLSRDFAQKQKNLAGALLNLGNMARAWNAMNQDQRQAFLPLLEKADKATRGMLAQTKNPPPAKKLAEHHNGMAQKLISPPASPYAMRANALAGEHLFAGLKLAGDIPQSDDDGIAAALNLNLALLSKALGESEQAGAYATKALAEAKKAQAPQLVWRAQVLTGEPLAALTTAETMSPFLAGCLEGELTQNLYPLVEKLAGDKKPKEAFDLLSRAYEAERFHLLAPYFFEKPTPELARSIGLARDRLARMGQIKKSLPEKSGPTLDLAREALAREEKLLEQSLAESPLPLLNLADSTGERDTLITLMAQALDTRYSQGEYAKYLDLAQEYRDELSALAKGPAPTGVLGLMGPGAPTAKEVMASLGEDEAFVWAMPSSEGGYVVFTMCPDELTAQKIASAKDFARPDAPGAYVAAPSELPTPPDSTRVLDAGHLLRSLKSKKPFKGNLAELPESPSAQQGFAHTGLAEANVLLVSAKVYAATSIPSGAGEAPRPFLAYEPQEGVVKNLAALLPKVKNLTATVFERLNPGDSQLLVHALALFGCPTTVEADPATGKAALLAFGEKPLLNAPKGVEVWGFAGMEKGAAAKFAAKKFVEYVKEGRALLDGNKAPEALRKFDDAVALMAMSPELSRYAQDLYAYSREAAFRAGNIPKALLYAQKLATLAGQKNPDSPAHADALLRLGLIQARAQNSAQAVKTLAEAAELFGLLEAGPDYAKALEYMGSALENTADYDGALESFSSAAKASDKELKARQFVNVGRILDMRLSNYAKAKLNYEKALEIYASANNPVGEAQTLVDIGRCQRLLGNFKGSEENFQLALKKIEGLADSSTIRAKILVEIANTRWYQGYYQEALDLTQKTLTLAREDNWDLGGVVGSNTLGLIFWTLNDYDRALSHLEEALALAQKLPNREDEVASSLNNIGLIHRERGDYKTAGEHFNRALKIDEKLGSAWGMAYDYRNLGLNLLYGGDAKGAVPLFEKAIELTQKIGNKINEAKAHLALGLAGEKLADTARARAEFESALKLGSRMYLREVMWSALHGLARLDLKQGDGAKAKERLREGITIVEGMRADIKIEQLRDGFIGDKMNLYADLIRLLADEGDVAGAFEVAERSRARNFIDLLGNNRLNLGRTADKELYERQKALDEAKEEIMALFNRAETSEEAKSYKAALDKLVRDGEELRLQMQSANPELASMVSVEPLKAADAQKLLDPKTKIAAYYLLENEILAWVAGDKALTLKRVAYPRAALSADILEYRRRIQNLEPVEELSRKLYGLLLQPVEEDLAGASRVGIVPHGALHNLAFATLGDREGYLIEKYPLFHLPSMSVFSYTTARRNANPGRTILAVGNPDLGNPALSLPFADMEVKTIGWNFPSITTYTGKEATKENILKNLSSFGVIHLASHGEFDPINPLMSALMLSPSDFSNGELNAREIFEIKLNADLVVLSACQTGLGKVTNGDELIGLNRSFLYAGTHAVLSSLWRVGDVSTAVLTKQFYRLYTQKDKAESLRGAILHVKNLYPHPGHWGAFTLVGDYY